MSAFEEFLHARLERGGFAMEDVLACFLPLLREVLQAHAAGQVAPLEGTSDLQVDGARLWFATSRQQPVRRNDRELRRIESANRAAIEILTERHAARSVDAPGDEHETWAEIGRREDPITRPVYLPGYVSWEHALAHHDPLTDLFSLGMLLASVACGLDLNRPEDLERFVTQRRNLFALRADLHPVLARAIWRMTDLDRHRRAQDLASILHSLEHYREQRLEFDVDLAQVEGFAARDRQTRQELILGKLRERLFDLSRRNSLLHFRSTLQSVNLTHASVPLAFDVRNIRADQILVWNEELRRTLSENKALSLNKYLNFVEALYLPSLLDRIIADSRRDQAEFGFTQLRLVLCFLSWANIKASPVERYESPLLLLPVRLLKSKGIRDTYSLEPLSLEAEVNPVLRYQFAQLYGIELPESIDLATAGLDTFFAYLSGKVQASEPAVCVNVLDRPRIDLVHDKARRRLDRYRRSARVAGRGVRTFLDLDYSYDAANYHPLGIKLFSAKVRARGTRLRAIIENLPRARTYALPDQEPPVVEKERTLYQLRGSEEENPYHWNVDLCSVTLAHFRYRRMSLVRDYEALLASTPANPGFDATFSLAPRPTSRELPQVPPLAERFDVLPCDPTQASAIAEARRGDSYIIQGPPGTGKSQTIANLIAEYVARGQRVLFVCQKRAAIDVVYARLRQCGLASLCALIHDSQTDKREFVQDLKHAYEGLLDDSQTPGRGSDRDGLLVKMREQLHALERFDAAMHAVDDSVGISVRQLLERCLVLRGRGDARPTASTVAWPDYALWWRHRDEIASFSEVLLEIQPDGILAHHPLRRLTAHLATVDQPRGMVEGAVAEARRALEHAGRFVEQTRLAGLAENSLERLQAIFEHLDRVAPLVAAKQMELLDSGQRAWRAFSRDVRRCREQSEKVSAAHQAARHWRELLTRQDLAAALAQARRWEHARFAWLQPAWWRLRAVLNRCFDFGASAVRPTWLQALTVLEQEYEARDELDKELRRARTRYGLDGDPAEWLEWIGELRGGMASLSPWVRDFHQQLLEANKPDTLVATLRQASREVHVACQALTGVLDDWQSLNIRELLAELEGIQHSLTDLPAFLSCLGELARLPPALASLFRSHPQTLAQVESRLAEQALQGVLRASRSLNQFTGVTRARHVSRLQPLHGHWLRANAAEILVRVRTRFREHVQTSTVSATQLDATQRDFKKHYTQGRRELEREFAKVMRHRSIRDLVTGDTGLVIKDLKPVWLMSPLSVSDTLPLETDFVDVVIFDEASQIPLEESIPCLFRAPRAIVVGDEMQLPPTDFFSVSRDEEDELVFEEEGETIQYDLASNSFLNHATRNLPSTMLGWHYRSRSESLISFSNWAFYDGRLLTVPEEQLAAATRQALLPDIRDESLAADVAEAHATELLSRAISFHQLRHGVYDQRRNRAEADYIALLVRALLARRNGLSLGVIAFSEAQQNEIESALDRLASQDAEFRDALDAEQVREVDGQFVGLLVKNLENIQGDERDVVLLSICYGPNPQGKTLMNFGPINKSGGEKRLNVAFSRAKQHLAIVSSILHSDITNDYNDGANCLKNFLRYAQAVSLGDAPATQRVLADVSRWQESSHAGARDDLDELGRQIKVELEARGYQVHHGVGQSHFRVDLAIFKLGDAAYRLGLLLDTERYYDQADLLERDLLRPRLLVDFGWRIAHVLAKDFVQDRQSVLDRLLALLASENVDDADQQEA